MIKKIIFIIIIFFSTDTYSQCFNGHFSRTGSVLKTTGNSILDSKFNSEKINIDLTFAVATDLYIMDDSGSPNALASCGSNIGDFDGTVRFGRNLLVNELYNSNKGEIAIAGILAHEIAHVTQCKFMSPLQAQYRELQADFLAGYYLGTRGDISYERLKRFYISLYEKGDWSDPTHHGTPVQRVNAMLSGFEVSNLNFKDAYIKSLEYIRGKSPDLPENKNTSNIFVNKFKVNIETIDDEEYLMVHLKDIEIYNQKNKEVFIIMSFVNENREYYTDPYILHDAYGFKHYYEESDILVPKFDSTSYDEIVFDFYLDNLYDIRNKTIIPLVQLYEEDEDGNLNRISQQYLKSFEISFD